ncbi:hypothetical protein EX30DRAFT_6712 [Ascodesmis nigricans]|uniref:Uncharacterized protein n=1 Tax=Ascodesmis nigricans TaxID=341454 RepID=A0A4S2N645_9PEZI|nr:hypothetical protein EX30DRAFT_6712 [Ascodesmis nigricans]
MISHHPPQGIPKLTLYIPFSSPSFSPSYSPLLPPILLLLLPHNPLHLPHALPNPHQVPPPALHLLPLIPHLQSHRSAYPPVLQQRIEKLVVLVEYFKKEGCELAVVADVVWVVDVVVDYVWRGGSRGTGGTGGGRVGGAVAGEVAGVCVGHYWEG